MKDVKYKFEIASVESTYLSQINSICKKVLDSNPQANSIFIYARKATHKIETNQELDLVEIQSLFDVVGRFYKSTKLSLHYNRVTESDFKHAKELMHFALRLERQIPSSKKFNSVPIS